MSHETFASEFAKISLLVNVGRINTTMAFFPDMKTALRTYHHIPSLQKDGGNVQDAPRIKAALKGSYLPFEVKEMLASSPARVQEFWRAGQRPPCSITGLIFVLSNNSAAIGTQHFDADDPFDFLDFFRPVIPRTAESRARSFLWLIYHYLEDTEGPNPFDDDFSRQNPGRAPLLRAIEDPQTVDVDTPEELEQGEAMKVQRRRFLADLMKDEEKDKRPQNGATLAVTDNSRAGTPLASGSTIPAKRRAPRISREASMTKDHSRQRGTKSVNTRQIPTASTVSDEHAFAYHSQGGRNVGHASVPTERSLLQHAWQTSFEHDPLAASDNEEDFHCRIDYERRLDVLTRLRGRPPSPEGTWNELDVVETVSVQ